jgi:endonuclease YncB( thermonuclease family)
VARTPRHQPFINHWPATVGFMNIVPLKRRRLSHSLLALCAAPVLLGLALLIAQQGENPSHAETPKTTPSEIAGTASIVDADTIDIHGQRIRLVGVDAPESGQRCRANGRLIRCGADAANALDAWIARNPVTCAIEGKDRYGRLLGQCSVRGKNIQEWLVTNGHALAYRDYSTAYVPAELKARKTKAGIWAGEFVAPWDWRKGLRLDGEKPTKAMLDGRFASN